MHGVARVHSTHGVLLMVMFVASVCVCVCACMHAFVILYVWSLCDHAFVCVCVPYKSHVSCIS